MIKKILKVLPFIAIYTAAYFLLLKDVITAYDCTALYIQTGISISIILYMFLYSLDKIQQNRTNPIPIHFEGFSIKELILFILLFICIPLILFKLF